MKRFWRVCLVLLCAFLFAPPTLAAENDGPAAPPRQPTYRNRGTASSQSSGARARRKSSTRRSAVRRSVRGGSTPAAALAPASQVHLSEPSPLNHAGCQICTQGDATVTWTGNAGEFTLDTLINNRTSGTSGPLRLSTQLTSTKPVFGQTIVSIDQSEFDVLGTLSAGNEFSSIDSGTVTFFNSSIPAGTYYDILLAEEQTGSTWNYTDFVVFNNPVLCSGTGCRTVAIDGDATLLVPIVLDLSGAGGSHYTTSLTLTNLTGDSVPVVLDYKSSIGAGTGLVPLTIANGEQIIVPDVIAYLRQQGLAIPNDGSAQAGTLFVVPPSDTDSSSFIAGARTSTPGPNPPGGTFGLYYPGLTLDQASDDTAYVTGLQQNGAQRSNLAVVNWGDQGDSISLTITYFDGNGNQLGAPVSVTLTPGQWLQYNTPLASLGATSGYAVIQEVSGNSSFVAYGVLNDAVTSDGSYIPMTF